MRIEAKGAKVSEGKGSFWTTPKYRVYRIGLMVLVLVLLTEIGVRVFFSRTNITDRNSGSTTDAMPYLFEQIAKTKGRKLVVIGSSVTQGYGNCLPGRHFPVLLEQKLRAEYGMKDVHAFNLSSAGNRFGDHFANLVEAERYKPALVIVAVHIKMFSVNSSLTSPIAYDEVLYYFRDQPEYLARYKKEFDVSESRYRQIWLDFQVRKLSALYRHRGLIDYLLTGNFHRPANAAAEFVEAEMGWRDPILVESARTTHTERNEDYLWKVIPNHVIQLNYQQCEAFDFSEENLNWRTFVELAQYAHQHKINLIFFLNPINRPFVDQKGFFTWDEVMPQFKQSVLSVTRRYHLRLVDAVEKVEPRYFSDLDHLNMNGHEQLAEALLPHVERQMRRR